jgi:hypothetical protein
MQSGKKWAETENLYFIKSGSQLGFPLAEWNVATLQGGSWLIYVYRSSKPANAAIFSGWPRLFQADLSVLEHAS